MSNIEGEFMDKSSINKILPEIPKDYIRLTHFTSEKVAKILVEKGRSFSYKKAGTISSTTDAFSNNESVLELIKTKQVGAFKRDEFGSAVVLIDIQREEHKKRYRIGAYDDVEIPNHNILGYILTDKEELELYKNPRYEPRENPLKPIPAGPKISAPKIDKNVEVVKASEIEENSEVW